ncbi:hypothetical protein KIW84_055478 [Lathyrus oleraceus]|uniref:Aconitase n=1 Tax=Pisum sativum TaxID=3888 RepID=A0A9D5AJT5_PEA|nr:hypothetical protein KIW84_055478 [Pisum sativum]
MSRHPKTGDWYPAINKPAGVIHCFKYNKDAINVDWVLILDTDMIIRGQIHVPIYVTNAEIAVLGSDLGSDETQKTLDLAGTVVVSLSANHLQKLTPDVNGLPHPLAKTKHILQYVRDTNSTYIHEPPYFKGMTMDPPGPHGVKDAYCLLNFGDSITTDHISPAGNINRDSPAHGTPHHLAKASNLPSDNKLQHTITS